MPDGLTLAALNAWLPSLFLHFVRIGAFFVGQPLFGVQNESRMLRLILMVSLGSIFFWVDGAPVLPVHNLAEYGGLVVREALVGLLLGYGARLMTTAMATAGEILSHDMGFAMAQVVNPATGRSSPVVSQLFEIVAFVLMLDLNVHHELLSAMAWVQDVLPVGRPFDIAPVFERLRAMVGESIVWGLRYAIPVMGVMILLTAVLVMLARAVSNINLMEFSFGLRILVALLASVYFLTEGSPFLERMFEHFVLSVRSLFAGA